MVDCRVNLLGGGDGWYDKGERPTIPKDFLILVHLCVRCEMDDDTINSTASYWRILLSYTVREATAMEERDNPCIFDDKEGRVGWTSVA